MRIVKSLATTVEAALSATPLTIAAIEASNRSAVDLYLHLHDTAVAVVNVATLVYPLPVPAGTRVRMPFPDPGILVANPRFSWSTTEATFTAYAGAASALDVYALTPNPEAA